MTIHRRAATLVLALLASALASHLAHAAPEAQAFWALIGMGAMLAGSLGVPLTAILFALEVTHCLPALLPLTLGCIASYLITALLMPRSILTEKLSRRGYHLTREYGVDPLETVIVETGFQARCRKQAVPAQPTVSFSRHGEIYRWNGNGDPVEHAFPPHPIDDCLCSAWRAISVRLT
jgi:hypothetical protein